MKPKPPGGKPEEVQKGWKIWLRGKRRIDIDLKNSQRRVGKKHGCMSYC